MANRWGRLTLSIPRISPRGKRHLDHLVAEYTAYYNHLRPHASRENLPPIRPNPEEVNSLSINQVEVDSRLGGLLKSFRRNAA